MAYPAREWASRRVVARDGFCLWVAVISRGKWYVLELVKL